MTPQEAQDLSASLFRQTFLMRMLKDENAHFLKTKAPSRLKNALYRGTHTYDNVVKELRICLPLSKEDMERELKLSDEKIYALNAIFEMLAPLDEKDITALEDEFKKTLNKQP